MSLPERRHVPPNKEAKELGEDTLKAINALKARTLVVAEKATRAPSGSIMSATQSVVSDVAFEECVNWLDFVTESVRRFLRHAP